MTLVFEDTINFNLQPSKCQHFDKGFCKQKAQCEKLHPSTDCDGKCVDQNACPFGTENIAKIGKNCMLNTSKTCEFLHNGETPTGN